MRITTYLPFPTVMRDHKATSLPLWWRRRATYVFISAVSVFLLYEYASYRSGSADDLQDPADEIPYDPTLDTVYLPFQPPTAAPLRRKLRPSLALPATCLDAHIAKGELCYSPAEPKLDVLWTWVNGSDLLLQYAKARVQEGMASDDPRLPSSSWKTIRQYR